MRILKHAGEERRPGEWKPLSVSDLNKWRARRRKNVAEGRSQYLTMTGTRNLPRVDYEEGDTAYMQRTGPVVIADPVETQRAVVDDYRAWINDPDATHEQRTQRLRILRALTDKTFEHLTDGQIGESLGEVSASLARESAERVYKRNDWDQGREITPGVRAVSAKSEYDAGEWAVPTGEAEPVDRRHKWQRSTD